MYQTTALFALIVTAICMVLLRPVAGEIGLLDFPGGRKRHNASVPVIGGIAMSIGIGLASVLIEQPPFFVPVIVAMYFLVAVGIIDDKYDLPASVRLVTQTVAAMLIVFGAGMEVQSLGEAFFRTVDLGAFSTAFTLLFFVALFNAFNVIDGIDGLAGGCGLLSLSALAFIGYGTDVFGLAVVALGAVAGFLLFNFPHRLNRGMRSFMGDAGSTLIGLLIATIGVSLSQDPAGNFAPVIGLWIVAVPVYDLFSAAIRRVMQKRSPFSPDHEHLHHILMLNGLSGGVTLCCMISLAVLGCCIGIVGHNFDVSQGLLTVGWLGGLVLYYQLMRHPRLIVSPILTLRNLSRRRARC